MKKPEGPPNQTIAGPTPYFAFFLVGVTAGSAITSIILVLLRYV